MLPPEPRPLTYHHCRELAHVRHRAVHAVRPFPRSTGDLVHPDRHDEVAYAWMADRCGFWPLWLAVGDDEVARRLTGYPNQWRRLLVSAPDPERCLDRRRGDVPSDVLFSWADAPAGVVHSDYHNWHLVLNSVEYEDRRQP